MEAPCSRFTAAEGGARLGMAASSQNTLAVEYATFISTRMIYELAYKIRGSLFDGKQRSVYVSRASRVDIVAYKLTILTDLKICKAIQYDDVYDWCAELDNKEVLVCTSKVLKQVLEEELLAIPNINVLILDSCHLVNKDDNLLFIMSRYKECDKDIRPRILALTYPLFSTPKKDNAITENKIAKVENSDEKTDSDLAKEEILPKLKAILASTEENLPKSEVIPSVKTIQKPEECLQGQEQTLPLTQNTTEHQETIITTDSIETTAQQETVVTTDSEIELTAQQQETVVTTDSEIEITAQQQEIVVTTDSEIEITTKEQINSQNIGVYENFDDFEMYEKLEWKIGQLEKELCCQMDLAEDIDGGKRLSATLAKPKELIIEYSAQPSAEKLSQDYLDLESFMKSTVFDALAFLDEHRYDPTEIYGEDLYEEFKNIPDPTIDPKYIFKQFLYVLEQLGPYAADKAAISLLTKSEKLKIKVPYERHFLLLCLCTSVFVKIRCHADQVFAKYDSDWEKIITFSTPKVIRFAEILEKFSPSEQFTDVTLSAIDDAAVKTPDEARTAKNNDNNCDKTDDNKHKSSINTTNELLDAIEKCDFISLSNRIEDTINTFEANLKDLEDYNSNPSENKNSVHSDKQNNVNLESESQNLVKTIKSDNENRNNNTGNRDNNTENRDNNTENRGNNTENRVNNTENGDNDRNDNNNDQNETNPNQQSLNLSMLGLPRRSGGYRSKGRGRTQRSNPSRSQQMQSNPDSLCGIVFMKEPLVAKIMFMLIVDMSRANPKLSFLCAQYCAVEQPADPGTEPRECQRQGKKQEDVLKKFRMHECNLLLATPALEEGIDLPRCNLVLRWDVPASYRSYGLCRGRARAPRSACAVLSCAGGGHTRALVQNVAVYRELDQIISRKCGCGIQNEPPQSEEDHADSLSHLIKPYTPFETDITTTNNHKNKSNNKKNEKKLFGIDKNSENKIGNSDNNTVPSVVNFISKADSAGLKEVNNLICNKCNIKREHDNTECPCVSHLSTGCNIENKNKRKDKISEDQFASVDLNSAIALINRYCGKLPSDTFTRLAPQWWMEEVQLPVSNSGETTTAYICTLRLPLNCPLKYNIVGHPMPTKVLARRMVALQACRILHKSGELDNQLMPIGKENFETGDLDTSNVESNDGNETGRPGTTKRRQYYFKRTASAFTNCQPVLDTSDSEIDPPEELNKEAADENGPKVNTHTVKNPGTKRNMLYAIVSKLWCALPERYNTRGRRLHVPQNASQAIGILMAREEPDNLQIPAFPVYTRSGEVRVSVEYVPDADVRLSPRRGRLIRRFMRFVFTAVLRVRRRGMRLQPDAAPHNDYYIVPTLKTTREDGSTKIDIDWAFLELIYQHTEEKKNSETERPNLWQNEEEDEEIEPQGTAKKRERKRGEVRQMDNPLLKAGETFVFNAERYREAVVTPWYRNQDQPQFFLVAEICWALTPDSAFPSATHTTFRQYYRDKYGVTLTQTHQPLLDVDHTSNRLNLLTPRYVNRKGVALPVSSERTRRAKRDRLDQKQILVPELCRVHPFAAPLWFATVALPCVLYRINALLIADEIRRSVAIDVGLGIPKIDETTCPGFQWTPLDFGWSLSEVLSADAENNKEEKQRDGSSEDRGKEENEQEMAIKDVDPTEEGKEKTINDILEEKESAESGFEIGTWSNEMASSIPQNMEYDEFMEPLPSNLTFCTSASGGVNWCDPVEKPKREFQPSRRYAVADSDCSYMSSDFDTDDSDVNSEGSDEDTDTSGFCSSRNTNVSMGVRIEYKTAHEAEAVDLERQKKVNPAPTPDDADDALDRKLYEEFIKDGEAPQEYIEKFHQSVSQHKKEIIEKGLLIKEDEPLTDILPEPTKGSHDKLIRNLLESKRCGSLGGSKKITHSNVNNESYNSIKHPNNISDSQIEDISNELSKLEVENESTKLISEIFPYGDTAAQLLDENGQLSLEKIEKNKRVLLAELKKSLPEEEIEKLNCFSMKDVDIDSPTYVNEKVVNIGFDTKENYFEKVNSWKQPGEYTPYYLENKSQGKDFDFDYQPKLEGHPGPSPSVILQALTMSNANDGINLERLETIGDSFLKFAITAYLYCAHPTVHEGKLSHMRSKQVSNLNLYRLGRNKRLGARMIASKFEPHDNWLPPCHKPPGTLHVRPSPPPASASAPPPSAGHAHDNNECAVQNPEMASDSTGCFIPYNLITQHSIPDKSIADCVEALIGAYLLECGPRGALLFMSWLGIRVLPRHEVPLPAAHPYVRRAQRGEGGAGAGAGRGEQAQRPLEPPPPGRGRRRRSEARTDSDTDSSGDDHDCWQEQDDSPPEMDWSWPGRPVGSLRPLQDEHGEWKQTIFGELKAPPSPLLRHIADPEGELEQMLSGYDALERTLQYRFKDRSLLLQALTHASHQQNRLTDCYQRLEFLGDAILDYLITRHLYEDPRRHSPGALTDLRSALVNNTIFATLAARHGFHKYFRHMAPGLNEVLTKYVKIQEENGHSISEEHYLIQEDAMEQAEDVEVPKALGDLFESVAGAVFLDSGMSLGAVWRSYGNLMGLELEAFSAAAPKSPVRELLEAEPDTAKFGKPERLADGRRVRVCVEVFGRGAFKGIGRNYRIAKGTAARCALRHLKGRHQR